MDHPDDERWMALAIALAMRGRGAVEPNPMVGCAIVDADGLVGQGFHSQFGGAHAEPTALADCKRSPAGATAYVNLEPCCHTNKKTPPCVPALIAAGIGRVVVGCLDPNPSVAGQGVEQLRAAGIEVAVGIGEAEAKQLNAAYFAGVLHHRPYVTLKWAETSDRKVAGPGGRRVAISNSASFAVIHGLRARSDAIMVGINTVLNDDPILSARGVEKPRKLLRVVLDTNGIMPAGCRLADSPEVGPVVVYGGLSQKEAEPRISRMSTDKNEKDSFPSVPIREIRGFTDSGVEFVGVPSEDGRVSLGRVLGDLHKRGVTHLLVEPGPTLARSFLESNLVDRVWRFQSRKVMDDPSAPEAQAISFPATDQVNLDGDLLTEYLNPKSDVYFAMAPSADLGLSLVGKADA